MVLYTYPGAVKVFGWHAKSLAKGILGILESPGEPNIKEEQRGQLVVAVLQYMSPNGMRQARDGYDIPCGWCGCFVTGPSTELGYKCMC